MKPNPAIGAPPNIVTIIASVSMLAMALNATVARADDGLSAAGSKQWAYTLTPYMWMIGMDGDMTVKGVKSEVNTSFGDILSNLDFAIQAHGEAWKGDWGLFLDGTYGNLGADGESGPVDVNVDTRFYQLEFGALYRAATWRIGDSGDREAGLELLAGGRFTDLKLDVDFNHSPLQIHGKDSWTDLIVGARLTAELSPNWSVILRGDVGGFGISGDKDMSVNGALLFGWHFKPDWHLLFGYRALYQDYQNGNGANEFHYKVTTHGPILGLDYSF